MANNIPDNRDDRRDVLREGSSLSGSTKRDNDLTERAMRSPGKEERQDETEVTPRSPERDTVDQDPGESQKRNQADEKDDPLAA